MRNVAILFISVFVLSGVSVADDESAVYVLDTPQLSCSYTSAEAKHAVEAIDNVNFIASDKLDHTLTVSLDTHKTTIDEVVGALADAGQDVSGYREIAAN